MRQRRQTPRPYLFVEAGEALQHITRVQSPSTQDNCLHALKNLTTALSEYTSDSQSIIPSTGGSFDLNCLPLQCEAPSRCRCYACCTSMIKEKLTDSGYSERYVMKIMSFWKRLVQLAMDQDRIKRFALPATRNYSRRLQEITVFQNEEVQSFLENPKVDPRIKVAFYIAVNGSLRRGELLHLQYTDIQWFEDGCDVEVQAKRCLVHNCRKVEVPNTHKSAESKRRGLKEWGWWFPKTRENRIASCPLGLKPYLEALKACSRESVWLFPGMDKQQPMSENRFSHIFRDALEITNLYKSDNGRWGFHTGRRTFITRHIRHVQTPEVANMAGCSIANLENYVSRDRERQRRLVSEMAERTKS